VDPVEQVAIGRVVQVPTVLFIGSWLRRKGVSVLVRAAARLHRAGVVVRWVLAGTGVDRSTVLREWPSGLEEVTEVIPSFPAAMESEILRRADIFVLPSFFEGQPLSLLQAMAAGLCCISTATCGQKELLIHEGNGLLAEVGDDMGLTHVLERAIADESLRAELGSAARGSVAERSWEAVGREFVGMLEERSRALGFSSAMQK
jgi:glycosyltransferase involved in cell wall biosynthesis